MSDAAGRCREPSDPSSLALHRATDSHSPLGSPGATGGTRMSSYGLPDGAAPPQPEATASAPPPISTYNPPSTAPVAPLSPSAQEGFGSNRFVTRLD